VFRSKSGDIKRRQRENAKREVEGIKEPTCCPVGLYLILGAPLGRLYWLSKNKKTNIHTQLKLPPFRGSPFQ
jgi:hypothetical protein